MSLSGPPSRATRILGRPDVERLLSMPECIAAVERAFLSHARGEAIPPAVLGAPVEGGGFHVKTAGIRAAMDGRPAFAAKINANFPGNPDRHGLPTIQGVLALYDAADGRLLALLDSGGITVIRTAAATAVAAKYLAPERCVVAICGCGDQARSQMRALACVRTVTGLTAIDTNPDRAALFARDMAAELQIEVSVATEPAGAPGNTNTWITCTPAHQWFLGRSHVAPGSFVAAVGADHPEKQEIEPALFAENVVIADLLDQCATMGDLHHALEAGVMRRQDVRAQLADLVSGAVRGRHAPEEIIIFDSTGTALQDVAAAMVVYERARAAGAGLAVDLGASSASEPAS